MERTIYAGVIGQRARGAYQRRLVGNIRGGKYGREAEGTTQHREADGPQTRRRLLPCLPAATSKGVIDLVSLCHGGCFNAIGRPGNFSRTFMKC